MALRPFRHPTQRPPRESQVVGGQPWLRALQGYWLFGEATGPSTRNLYGSSGPLVYNGTPEWTRGGAGASGGNYLQAVTPTAVGPLSLILGLIPRGSGFTRYAQWDSVGPVLFDYSGSLAIVFQNEFDFNPGGVPLTAGTPAVIGLTADGSTARVFSYQNGVFTYAEELAFGRSYAGFLGALRIGAGGLGGGVDAADAVYLWAAIHHRALSLDELRAVCRAPYATVAAPGDRARQWYVTSGGGAPLPTVAQRGTLSPLGTRTGSRQTR